MDIDPLSYGGILLVATAPLTNDEIHEGRPLAGGAGYILGRWLRSAGLKREQLAITTLIRCLGDESFLNQDEVFSCTPYLLEAIASLHPKVIVTLGQAPLTALAGVSGLVDRRAPRMGYVHLTQFGPVIASPDPAYIRQGNAHMTPYAELALLRARQIAGLGCQPSPPQVFPDVPLNIQLALPSKKPGFLMLDIETDQLGTEDERGSEGIISRIGFAWREDDEIRTGTLPWNDETAVYIQRLIRNAQTTCFWNETFDRPRLEHMGIVFGNTLDAMLLWHWLQPTLPKALGAAAPFFWGGEPWKHLSIEAPEIYNARDAYMQLVILEGVIQALGEKRLAEYERLPGRMTPLLLRVSQTGILKSESATKALIEEVKRRKALAQPQLDSMIPPALRPVKIVSREPLPELHAVEQSVIEVTKSGRRKPLGHPEAEFAPEINLWLWKVQKRTWAIPLPFLIESPKQVLALAKAIGIHLQDTNEKTLARHQHPVFRKIVEMRKLNDVVSNFAFKAASDGAVHPRLSYFPSTFRKSCREPNLQSLPARHSMVKLIRAQLQARPGHIFVAGDSSAIEAVLVGWLARSTDYIRLAKAGVHGWLTSALHQTPISLALDDGNLATACKDAKKMWPVDYDKCKRVVHLTNYGGTANRMFLEYPDVFHSVADARQFQKFYLDTQPGRDMVQWQRQTVMEAHRRGYLETIWGCRNYYYRALVYNSLNASYEWGEQAKEAIAFMPQSMASSIQDEFVLALPAWMQDSLRLLRHDEILCEVPESRCEEALDILYETMTMKLERLDGLLIGAEMKCGYDFNLDGK
ncbi:MAG: DNA polymerase [Terriglobia bacterium]